MKKPSKQTRSTIFNALIIIGTVLVVLLLTVYNMNLAIDEATNFKNTLGDALSCMKELFALIPTANETDPATAAADIVRGFFATYPRYFVDGAGFDPKFSPKVLGKLRDDDGYSYLTVEGLKEICKLNNIADPRTFGDGLTRSGFFVADDKVQKGRKTPRSTVMKRIGSLNVRCYRIKTQVLEGVDS